MEELLIIYFTPDSVIAEVADIHIPLDYSNLKDISLKDRRILAQDMDFFTIQDYAEAFNSGRISDEGYIGYLTQNELTELFNL